MATTPRRKRVTNYEPVCVELEVANDGRFALVFTDSQFIDGRSRITVARLTLDDYFIGTIAHKLAEVVARREARARSLRATLVARASEAP